MTEVTITTYPRPQDKYGLLWHMRVQALDSVMEQLEQILIDFDVYTILDCACGDGLYTAALAGSGRSVSAADDSPDAEKLLRQRLAGRGDTVPFRQADIFSLEQAYPEKFDAILCLNGELARYGHTEAALQALFSNLNHNGILVLGITDVADFSRGADMQHDYDENPFIPLLLGVEHEGKKCSVIQNRRHDFEMAWMVVNNIYHIEDPATGVITVDWEEAKQIHLPAQALYELEEIGGWYIHKDVRVGGERLLVCGLQPPRKRMGPKSYFGDSDDQ